MSARPVALVSVRLPGRSVAVRAASVKAPPGMERWMTSEPSHQSSPPPVGKVPAAAAGMEVREGGTAPPVFSLETLRAR